ncbi:MAG TPA: GTPase [Candidatus Acidoferrum sp.]|nr:GTPase [Candidatus Acidoferrum sp.]
MPANLTPEYEKAEQRYREASDDAGRLAALQEMLATVPKHKGTEKLQADIKHRLSQLRRDQQRAGHTAKGPDPFHIARSGAGQVVLIGPPNTGKSSLLAAVTHAQPHVADYPFTTVVPQPGMWTMDDVPIELVDTPPFTAEHMPAGLLGAIHNANVVSVVVEAGDSALDQAEMALGVLAARGLTLQSAPPNELAAPNAGVRPGLIAVNKAELAAAGTVEALRGRYRGALEVLAVSARTGNGLEDWFRRLWALLGMIRVYAKEPGQPPDRHKPFTLPIGATIADLAHLIHRDLPATMKFARLWGHGRFDGQQVHRTEVLRDRDVVEIHE